MENNRRSGDRPDIVVKRRSSSGCLIVRKKSGDAAGIGVGVGSSGSSKGFDPKRERKRPKFVMSDSGSSDELLLPPPRRGVAAETIRVCSGLSGGSDRGVVESRDLAGRNGGECRKRDRLDVFEFDEYDGIDGESVRRRHFNDGRKLFLGSPPMSHGGGAGRQFESGSNHGAVERRKDRYFDGASMPEREACMKRRYEVEHDMEHRSASLKEKCTGHSDEAIRVQGKNGVLRVLLNKKKKASEPLRNHDQWGSEETSRKSMKTENFVKPNSVARSSLYSETKRSEISNSSVILEKKKLNSRSPILSKVNKSGDNNMESDDSDTSSKQGPLVAESKGTVRKLTRVDEDLKKPKIQAAEKIEKTSAKKMDKTPAKKMENPPIKTPSSEKPSSVTTKEGSVRRGSGTEKQKLRDRIKLMLLEAGWSIDYRPRRNRDYQDAVYINPTGTAYWSIIKAYDALQKQLGDDGGGAREDKHSAFTISDETLSQLTRKTQKKIEKEMKKTKTDGDRNQSVNSSRKRNAKIKHEEESMDSDSEEQKLSSFIKQGSKSSRSRTSGNDPSDSQNINKQLDSTEKVTFGSGFHLLQGRKNRKLGRCTLLVRGSDKTANAEGEEFVPYTGKRTLLSWLIDSGVVKLSQKVQYMNRRKTRVMLEGWVTGDGIHCVCCSKILSVSKFEIHAGSKLRQPFQHIHLDSGVSLLQCQIDAWNKQEESLCKGFFTVDIDGDDPNDDTCSICGDGGDLICCDGCPSTFHLNCLNIQMLPPGDWHCPNCTCKYCGVASCCVPQSDPTSVDELYTCKLCEKKFHKSCIEEEDVLSMDSSNALLSFCNQKCRELFGSLRKCLGVKHELEAGFSWSLIHRTDPELDSSLRGLPQRVECNSKLAVALAIMDECFLPIVDRRSKINMLHSVLYNCGSNFNRLNFSGFYTIILERGDEIISAASLRFHGTKLVEMPFIGTRHIYRHQGMCRRLFSAIEAILCSLKVENLVIPAVSELIDTWTGAFGFTSLEDSLKQEMRSLNMLVFPGLDMLQKQLPQKETAGSSRTAGAGVNLTELKQKEVDSPLAPDKSDDALAEDDLDQSNESEDSHASDMSAKVDTMDDDKVSQEFPVNGSSNVPDASNSDPTAAVKSGKHESVAPFSAIDKQSDREDEVAQALSSKLGEKASQIVEINGVNDASVSSVAKDSRMQFKGALSSDNHCSPMIEDKPAAGSSVPAAIEVSNILDANEAKVDVGCMETSPALVENKLTSSSTEGPLQNSYDIADENEDKADAGPMKASVMLDANKAKVDVGCRETSPALVESKLTSSSIEGTLQDSNDIADENDDKVDAGRLKASVCPVENRTRVSYAEGTSQSSCDIAKANEMKVEIVCVEAYLNSGEDGTHVCDTFHDSSDIPDVKEAKIDVACVEASPLSSVDKTCDAIGEGMPHASGGADGDVAKVNLSCMGCSPSLDDKIQDSTMQCTQPSCNRDIDNVNGAKADITNEPCSALMEDNTQQPAIGCPSQVSIGVASINESKADDACKAHSSVAINTQDISIMSTGIPPSFHSGEESTFICQNSCEVDCNLAESAGQIECLSSDLIDSKPVLSTSDEGMGKEMKKSNSDEWLT